MVNWTESEEIKVQITRLVKKLDLSWIDTGRISCYSSTGSQTRAYARIWGLGKIWQLALKEKPYYVIEVISEKFNRLNGREKEEVLIHELMHIPKNFSGALLPHIRKRGKRNFHDRVKRLVMQLGRNREG